MRPSVFTQNQEDVPQVEFMCLVFTHMPGESYCRWLGSLLLCLCHIFPVLINSLVCCVCFCVFQGCFWADVCLLNASLLLWGYCKVCAFVSVSMLAVHIPDEDRCLDVLELIQHKRLLEWVLHNHLLICWSDIQLQLLKVSPLLTSAASSFYYVWEMMGIIGTLQK